MYKKLTLTIFVVFLAATFLGACASEPEECLGTAEDAIVDLECREIIIAMENAYLPFNYVSLETGEALGWDYDAWDEICTRLHCTPVYTEASWDGMIQAVADGQFDAAADGITITEDRAEIVDFSIGYISLEQRLLVRKDETRINNIQDVVDDPSLLFGTQVGTTNYEVAKGYLPEERIQAYETFPFAVQACISGDLDAVIIDDVAGQGYVGEGADQIKLVGDSLSSDWLGFIYPKGSDLVDPVNQAMRSMMEDGFLAELNKEYFGPTFTITYDDIAEIDYGDE
jgi:polar amino acid transport system substrate-binding protein